MKSTARFYMALVGFAAALALAGSANITRADTVAFAPANGVFSENYNPIGNDGFFFTPNVNVYVTALGYYVDGLAHTDAVGIYQVDSPATPLVETTVTVAATVDNLPTEAPPAFDYAAVTLTELFAGTAYAVVGNEVYNLAGQYVTPGDGSGITDSDIDAASQLTFDGYQYDYNGSLDLPGIPYTTAGYFGPNFQFTDSDDLGATAPLPGAFPAALVLFALCGGLAMARRRRMTA
jgi:hypothetical protein